MYGWGASILCQAFLTDVVATRDVYPICGEDAFEAYLTLERRSTNDTPLRASHTTYIPREETWRLPSSCSLPYSSSPYSDLPSGRLHNCPVSKPLWPSPQTTLKTQQIYRCTLVWTFCNATEWIIYMQWQLEHDKDKELKVLNQNYQLFCA